MTTHLLISPSKTLVRFADQIASFGKGPVLDAPCGSGRNAIALAMRGCTVVAVDSDRRRLMALEQVKATYTTEPARASVAMGQIFTVCADLKSELWPFAPLSFSAIVCIHFAMLDLLPCFIASLKAGGYIYLETFGGHGQNFCELPRVGQLRKRLSTHVKFKYYKERKVGPMAFDSVWAILFGQKRMLMRPPRRSAPLFASGAA